MGQTDQAVTFDGVDAAVPPPFMDAQAPPPPVKLGWGTRIKNFVFGTYDYKHLCLPQWPWCRSKQREGTVFFAKDERMALVLALVMGFQHFLAMCVGLITPPLLVGNLAGTDTTVRRYMVSASLIVAGLATLLQVYSVPIWPKWGIRLGSGLLSTMGITIVFVSIATNVVGTLIKEEGKTFSQAFGAMMGTIACVSWIPMLFSFIPPKWLHRVFSDTVIGGVVVLIGVKLVGVGFEYWGGGAFCAADPKLLCINNGYVRLPFGSPPYIGLGFAVFSCIVLIELFGSPFLRNASIVIGLLVGYLIAGVTTYGGKSYVNTTPIQQAPAFTFLWTTTFPLTVYPAALLPSAIGVIITSVETIGDVTATEEASFLDVEGPEHNMHVKGGLLNDGFMTLLASLSGVLPVTTFAQNNGIIAITRCASRSAGYAAAFWLLSAGIIAKFGAWIVSIPHCVLGGATAFLFANVAVSGIRILMSEPLTRRNRFIAACMFTFGLGVSLVPRWATQSLWPRTSTMSGLVKSINQAVMLILSTGFVIGCVVGVILNLLLPLEEDHELLEYELKRMQERVEKSRSKRAFMSNKAITTNDSVGKGSAFKTDDISDGSDSGAKATVLEAPDAEKIEDVRHIV